MLEKRIVRFQATAVRRNTLKTPKLKELAYETAINA